MSAVIVAYLLARWAALPDRWMLLSLAGGVVASTMAVLA